MTKAPQAFRTISEVSETLDVPQHVLRFWEGKFAAIKPLKRAGGRRYYRPEDIDLLRGIRALLYAEGYTIKGVQKVLRESGARHVCEIGRYGVSRGEWAADSAKEGDDARIETGDQFVRDETTEPREGEAEGPSSDAEIASRRATLEATLGDLLALRDLLRAARPKKADAA